MDKLKAREYGKAARNSLTFAERKSYSEKISDKLLEELKRRNAKSVFIYINFECEVQTKGIIKELIERNIAVFVPKIVDNEMFAVEIRRNTEYTNNKYGISEPKDFVKASNVDVAVCPLVAFSENLDRVGMGKGYYDRFLKEWELFRIGIAFEAQKLANIAMDSYDETLDLIITENNIYRRNI